MIELSRPASCDGAAVHRLVGHCPPLDSNSMYCNLLQATHFSGTSVAAKSAEELVGFVSGYRVPERLDTLFIWQVAVGDKARGRGLATNMLQNILGRKECEGVRYIETTITESNRASWSLFECLALKLKCALNSSVMFDKTQHFEGVHDTEMLVKIGPFERETHCE